MTSPGQYGGVQYQSPTDKALGTITSQSYAYKDQGAVLSKLVGDVSFMADNQRQMQRGIDKANENVIQQLQGTIKDITALFGGGSPDTMIDLGDLRYVFQGLGALFGFGDGSGNVQLPLNLFDAATHFITQFFFPSQNWKEGFDTFTDNLISGILNFANGIDHGGLITQIAETFAEFLSDTRDFAENALEWLGDVISDIFVLIDILHFIYPAGETSDKPMNPTKDNPSGGPKTWYAAWNDLMIRLGFASENHDKVYAVPVNSQGQTPKEYVAGISTTATQADQNAAAAQAAASTADQKAVTAQSAAATANSNAASAQNTANNAQASADNAQTSVNNVGNAIVSGTQGSSITSSTNEQIQNGIGDLRKSIQDATRQINIIQDKIKATGSGITLNIARDTPQAGMPWGPHMSVIAKGSTTPVLNNDGYGIGQAGTNNSQAIGFFDQLSQYSNLATSGNFTATLTYTGLANGWFGDNGNYAMLILGGTTKTIASNYLYVKVFATKIEFGWGTGNSQPASQILKTITGDFSGSRNINMSATCMAVPIGSAPIANSSWMFTVAYHSFTATVPFAIGPYWGIGIGDGGTWYPPKVIGASVTIIEDYYVPGCYFTAIFSTNSDPSYGAVTPVGSRFIIPANGGVIVPLSAIAAISANENNVLDFSVGPGPNGATNAALTFKNPGRYMITSTAIMWDGGASGADWSLGKLNANERLGLAIGKNNAGGNYVQQWSGTNDSGNGWRRIYIASTQVMMRKNESLYVQYDCTVQKTIQAVKIEVSRFGILN